ncbi:MAG TPA: hypothetical protein VFS34_17825 [Thermoanaerobaculia bacterium]|nr:hypothetical protein [Thermoanaerobaculia bacterium]
MKVGAIRRFRTAGGEEAVSARVEWEDAVRAPLDLRFSFLTGDVPSADPNAFVIAVFVAALRARERRIAVEGAICPVLRDGLRAAAAVLRTWYGGDRPLPALEPSEGFRAASPPAAGGEAIFLSGGLDSLHLLLSRGSGLPREHPAAVRHAIFVSRCGLFPEETQMAEAGARSERAARAIAAEAGLPLTVVSTNLLELEEDLRSFSLESHGAFFAAIAQVFSGRFSAIALAASDDAMSGLHPWGSHPLLDPLFGTSALRFVHDGIGVSREEKAARVGRSGPEHRHLFTCTFPLPGDPLLNCGKCEKCLRTMMELLVAGALADSETFPRDITAEAIRDLPGVAPYRRLDYYWKPLASAARRVGRPDLGAAIEERLEAQRRAEAWERNRGWTGLLRRLDRRWLGGRALALRRRIARAAS